jgi:hypothetical protein
MEGAINTEFYISEPSAAHRLTGPHHGRRPRRGWSPADGAACGQFGEARLKELEDLSR